MDNRGDIRALVSRARRQSPWSSWSEWREMSRTRILCWHARATHSLSHAVYSTAMLIHISKELQEVHTSTDTTEGIRMHACMVFVRFVNGFIDEQQHKRAVAHDMYGIAAGISLPQVFIDIRHEATHNRLPSIGILRIMTKQALDWLQQRYWEPQLLLLESRVETLRTHIQTFASLLVRKSDWEKKINYWVDELVSDFKAVDIEWMRDVLVPVLLSCCLGTEFEKWNVLFERLSSIYGMAFPVCIAINCIDQLEACKCLSACVCHSISEFIDHLIHTGFCDADRLAFMCCLIRSSNPRLQSYAGSGYVLDSSNWSLLSSWYPTPLGLLPWQLYPQLQTPSIQSFPTTDIQSTIDLLVFSSPDGAISKISSKSSMSSDDLADLQASIELF